MISSCQKELNFDDTLTGQSKGSLKKDTTDCYPSTVQGEYIVDSALNSTNFIDLQVNVTTTGYYVIYSDTVNGYYFRGNGTFGNVGLNSVRLYGYGTPEHSQPDPFIIRYDTSLCIVDVDVTTTGIQAVYTFGGAGGTCSNVSLGGTYTMGTALNSTNTAQVDLQISTPGNYSITTTQVNGVIFSATGEFLDTTPSTVTLTGSGTPVASGTFNFPLLGNGTSCAFSVTFQ